jgi:hypothetical protein
VIPVERIEQAIYVIRGHKVMLDADLALLYGVETKALNRAVGRSRDRFPEDFMFRLTAEEFANLRYQIGTSSSDSDSSQPSLRYQSGTLSVEPASASARWGGRRYPPYAFTEQGVAMLSGVLTSPRAVAVNVEIMRAFVRLRRLLAENADLARKVDALERKYDRQFKGVFDAIRHLMAPPVTPDRRIGFRPRKK